MRILLTNDDGIDADGLAALERVCEPLASEIIVVAPAEPASQVGHRVTTHEPLHLSEHHSGRRYAVHGSPADCVRVALKDLLAERPPDWVVSGINHGGNLGRHDIYISGTVAAAREAAFHGIPAVAVSHFLRSEFPLDWPVAEARARRALESLLEERLGDGELWNINLPHLPPGAPEPEIRHCEPERQPLEVRFQRESGSGPLHYTGRYHHRPHNGESDVAVCFGGDIAVSRLCL
ncbi:MAG: 5'/3'-nucleotidase SurE [Verrucomicrobiae bacterium]|nr:5'/3'-nucleotidase SurE [Verrucomicrobiae bacterium]